MNILAIANTKRKWYQVILWWELRRLLYNLIMMLAGFLSFFIGYATIPLIYVFIGFWLNVFYTLGWVTEIVLLRVLSDQQKFKYPKYFFVSYLVLSISLVMGVAIYFMPGR